MPTAETTANTTPNAPATRASGHQPRPGPATQPNQPTPVRHTPSPGVSNQTTHLLCNGAVIDQYDTDTAARARLAELVNDAAAKPIAPRMAAAMELQARQVLDGQRNDAQVIAPDGEECVYTVRPMYCVIVTEPEPDTPSTPGEAVPVSIRRWGPIPRRYIADKWISTLRWLAPPGRGIHVGCARYDMNTPACDPTTPTQPAELADAIAAEPADTPFPGLFARLASNYGIRHARALWDVAEWYRRSPARTAPTPTPSARAADADGEDVQPETSGDEMARSVS